jgi:hypothetical protein
LTTITYSIGSQGLSPILPPLCDIRDSLWQPHQRAIRQPVIATGKLRHSTTTASRRALSVPTACQIADRSQTNRDVPEPFIRLLSSTIVIRHRFHLKAICSVNPQIPSITTSTSRQAALISGCIACQFAPRHQCPPFLHMPTLGFLKKKRTKESPGSKDSPSSSQVTSPITPTTSRGFDNSIASASSTSTAPQAQSAPQSTAPSTAPTNKETPATAGEQQPMTQGVAHHQQTYAASPHTTGDPLPAEQQNLPSINSLINPPQHDGAAQSYPAQMSSNKAATTANGGADHSDILKQAHNAPPQQTQIRQTKGKYSLTDFDFLRTLGTGSFGRVHLVQSKHNQRFYAVKVLKKQQVVKMKQVEHTNDERKMLQEVKHPFLITLWGTFQDSKNLYMVMDFVEGGELFSLLRKSQVNFSHLEKVCMLIHILAIPQSSCEILCRGSHSCP